MSHLYVAGTTAWDSEGPEQSLPSAPQPPSTPQPPQLRGCCFTFWPLQSKTSTREDYQPPAGSLQHSRGPPTAQLSRHTGRPPASSQHPAEMRERSSSSGFTERRRLLRCCFQKPPRMLQEGSGEAGAPVIPWSCPPAPAKGMPPKDSQERVVWWGHQEVPLGMKAEGRQHPQGRGTQRGDRDPALVTCTRFMMPSCGNPAGQAPAPPRQDATRERHHGRTLTVREPDAPQPRVTAGNGRAGHEEQAGTVMSRRH